MIKPIKYMCRLMLCAMLLLVSISATYAQSITIKGRITDGSTKEPMIGATVMVKGSQVGASTDLSGNYTVSVPSTTSVLVFSSLGYENKEVTVGSSTVVDVVLSETSTELNEVVVVGYGTMRKRDLTGASTSISSAAFETSNTTSVQSALSGRVAGVQITANDNAPGSGFTISVRGGSTLTSGNEPLYVIDGFPMTNDSSTSYNPLADINPAQIASIDVMKDASSTAIYGAAGANGVILITTKQGTADQPRINLEYRFGISKMVNNIDVLDPDEYVDYMIDRYWQGVVQGGNYSSMDSYLKWVETKESGEEGHVWLDEISQLGKTHNVNASVRGGNKGMNYQIGGSYTAQEGVILNSEYQNLSFNSTVKQKIGTRMNVSLMVNAGFNENQGMGTGDQYSVIKKALHTSPFLSTDYSIDESDDNANSTDDNLLNYLDVVDISTKSARIIANASMDYQLRSDLVLFTSYGIVKQYRDNHKFMPASTQQGKNYNGFATLGKTNFDNYVFQVRANYTKSIGEHNISGVVAFEAKETNNYAYSQRLEGFGDDTRGIWDLSTVTYVDTPSYTATSSAVASWIARGTYSFKDRYTFNASLRVDGDSRFGADNKWGYFPAAAAAWIVSEEDWFKRIRGFNLLKFRLSYGITGNNQIGSYESLSTMDTNNYQYGGTSNEGGKNVSTVGNPDLSWESTRQYNVGVDMGFLRNRILLTIDAYHKQTVDLLLDVDVPAYTGFTTQLQNLGEITNRGIEFALNTVNVETKNFKWTSAFTLSFNRSKVIDIGTSERFFTRNFYQNIDNDVLLREGLPVGVYYGYVEDGVINSETEGVNSPVNTILGNSVGQVKLKDLNGDGIINTDDQAPIAYTSPDFIGGFSNMITWKNLDVSFMFRWSYGNDIINGNKAFIMRAYYGTYNILQSAYDNAWTYSNVDGTSIGAIDDRTIETIMTDRYVEDGSFLKCDYINLGYTFNSAKLKSHKINKIRIYAGISNPFIITNYGGFDPDIAGTTNTTAAKVGPGADVGNTPMSKTVNVGISVNL